MTKHSNNWRFLKFEDAVTNVNDRINPTAKESDLYIGLEHMDNLSMYTSKWGTEVDLVGTKFLAKKDDILLARRNPYLRRVQLSPHDCIFSAHGMVFRSKPEVLDHLYLFTFLTSQTFWEMADQIAVGSLSKTLNWGDLAKLVIPAPPLDTQIKIRNLYLLFENYIKKLISIEESLVLLRRKLLSKHFESTCEKFDISTLSDVAKWGSGGTPKVGVEHYYGGEIPWCVIGDLNEGMVFDTEKRLTQAGIEQSSAKVVPPGTVLLAMYGASIGRTGIAAIPMATNQAVAFANVLPGTISSEYLLYFLQSQKQNFVQSGQGAAQPNISQTIIKSWPIAIPDQETQYRLVQLIGKIDESISEARESAFKARSMRQVQLNKIFRSETKRK